LANVSGSENYKILSRQLDVERMMEKNVEKLSGGELQRIAILLCLSRDCDLYLLDEPSAYLDVDQRLAVAKAMKDAISNTAKSVIVIDHDLLFLSYVADRAMVFSGIPGISGTAVFMNVRDGFNKFLKEVGITFRRDPETKRPRANKPGSVQDREQKEKGEYFY
jgi:ATP-binding cassette subfamily E protein 1